MNNFGGQSNTKKKNFYITAINPITVFIVVILIVIFMSMTNKIFAFGNSKEKLEALDQFESNKNAINMIEIRSKNTEKVRSQLVFIDERDLDFTTVRRTNDELPKDEIKVVQQGKKGKEQISIKKVFENDELIEEDMITNCILEGPVAEILEIGTKEVSTPKETPQNSFIPDTYEDRKAKVFSSLGFVMDLRRPSGLVFEDFKKIATNDQRDRYSVFANNVETFYAIEQKYNINGVFVMALAIHESGWGMSNISKDKKNLFGYGAYDRDPYNSAFNFDSYGEGIELVSRALVKNYLNEKGTPIFDGQVATGSFYNGPTLAGINVRYATDPEWSIKIFKIMEYLYSRL